MAPARNNNSNSLPYKVLFLVLICLSVAFVGQSMWYQSVWFRSVTFSDDRQLELDAPDEVIATAAAEAPVECDEKSATPIVETVPKETNEKENILVKTESHRSIAYIPTAHMDTQDIFAASWWQSLARFRKLDTDKIGIVEDDSFAPVLRVANGLRDARMAVDWLDFATEHLSKWWKLIDARGQAFAIGKLQGYVQRAMSNPPDSNLMNSTIAVIPYGVTTKERLTQTIWHNSLAATIAALVRQGVARVLVVGYYETDTKLTMEAFQHLKRYHNDDDDDTKKIKVRRDNSFSTTLGTTELAYVTTTDVESKFIKINVPKGALKGLLEAFNKTSGSRTKKKWLGSSPERFKYVFLTESDQIVHARLSSRMLKDMNDGGILVPHRLQPIPHPLDLRDVVEVPTKLLPPTEFSHVHELGMEDSCCDTTDKGGMQDYETCGDFWWICGFRPPKFNHTRVSKYALMRLTGGTGVVNLASTEHSRKCIPAKKSEGGCPAK